MPPSSADPTEAIRLRASGYPDMEQGTACTQSSFKVGKKGFLFIGEQGGRHKAMFKLQDSVPEAERLQERQPQDYQVGKGGWVTARFSADAPLPAALWKKWLDESHAIAGEGAPAAGARPRKKA